MSKLARYAVLLLAALASLPGRAVISGRVFDSTATTETPLAGAEIRLQATGGPPLAITNAAGQYTLAIEPTEAVKIAAARPYSHAAGATNYATEVVEAVNGQTNADIFLPQITPHMLAGYTPPTAQNCGNCHVNQRSQWAASRHADADNNPWVLDLYSGTGTAGGMAGYVFLNSHSPGDSGFCATCHAPLEDVFTPGQLKLNQVATPAGQDGVSCQACHQIANVDAGNINGLHHVSKTAYLFPEPSLGPTAFYVFGPLPDVDTGFMRNIYSPLFKQPLLCASCHQYNNPTTGAAGQNTYVEWTQSPYAVPGPNFRTCQDCHMPPASGPGTLATISPVIRPAEQRRNHQITGANQATLSGAILLRSRAEVVGNQLVVTAEVENRGAGHSFPTGISIRNALLVIEASANGIALVQASGPTVPDWASDDVPGVQPGDLAGRPGTGFVKLLRGRINGQGNPVQPVLFIDAETVAEDTVLPSGQTRTVEVRFDLPAGTFDPAQLRFDSRLLWRRAFRALAVTKGWTVAPNGGPIEIQVSRVRGSAASLFQDGFE